MNSNQIPILLLVIGTLLGVILGIQIAGLSPRAAPIVEPHAIASVPETPRSQIELRPPPSRPRAREMTSTPKLSSSAGAGDIGAAPSGPASARPVTSVTRPRTIPTLPLQQTPLPPVQTAGALQAAPEAEPPAVRPIQRAEAPDLPPSIPFTPAPVDSQPALNPSMTTVPPAAGMPVQTAAVPAATPGLDRARYLAWQDFYRRQGYAVDPAPREPRPHFFPASRREVSCHPSRGALVRLRTRTN